MRNFQETEKKYTQDAAFNKMVNLFVHLIEEYDFEPSEIREALFYAQYKFQINSAKEIIRTEKDWEKIAQARLLMRQMFAEDNPRGK